MIERNIGPAVGVHDGLVELGVDLAKAEDVGVGGLFGVVDEVVELGEAELTAEHDLAPRCVEHTTNCVKPSSDLRAGKVFEYS